MFTKNQLSRSALIAVSFLALSACASQAPKVSNASLGYAVTNHVVSADSEEQALSGALGTALNGVGIATAMPAKAEVTIDFVRYNSPFIGLFYGGQHYASLSVVLNDSTGARITSFPVYVAANGDRSTADYDLATAAAQIIAAKAANAFMPLKTLPKALPKAAPERAASPMEPAIDIVTPPADEATPCVIGPDGKCLAL
jgi:hypothetical protein